SREASLVIAGFAEVRVAPATRGTAPAVPKPFSHNGFAEQRRIHGFADPDHGAGPFMSWRDRIPHERVLPRAHENLAIGPADPRPCDPDDGLARPWPRGLDRHHAQYSRPFDQYRTVHACSPDSGTA